MFNSFFDDFSSFNTFTNLSSLEVAFIFPKHHISLNVIGILALMKSAMLYRKIRQTGSNFTWNTWIYFLACLSCYYCRLYSLFIILALSIACRRRRLFRTGAGNPGTSCRIDKIRLSTMDY